jgi:CheY-like chemotaxis protein
MPGAIRFIADQVKSSWNHADLKTRIILPAMVVLSIITGFAGLSFYRSEQNKLLEELSLRGQAITASLSVYSAGALTNNRKTALKAHAAEFIEGRKILHQVSIYKGQELYLNIDRDQRRGKIRPQTLKHYQLPVYALDGTQQIGRVEVSLSTQEIENHLAVRAIQIIIVAVIVVLTSTVLLSWLISQVVIAPLERLTHKIQMLSMGRLNQKVVSMSWDEIGHLFRDINALRIRFKRDESEFINAIIDRKRQRVDNVPQAHSKALVIDDDEIIRMHANALLQKDNIEVTLASDGKQGLEALFNGDFDLVLLDLMMPGMTGYEVLQEIRKRPSYNDLPVIIISSVSDKTSIVTALDDGAVDYIIKPFDNNELIARVNIHLSASLREKEIDQMLKQRITSLKKL